MEVASTIQLYTKENSATSNEDFDEDWQRRLRLSAAVLGQDRKKNSRYWMFSLLRLCFVFYGEIYVKNG